MSQRSLAALRIGNFKAFADTQRIPLKPITLIFGANSAGKSSFIHSLAFAHEAEFGRNRVGTARLDVHRTTIGGNSIDLGGFRQFVHRGQAGKRVEWGADLNVSALDKRLQELLDGVEQVSVTLTIGIQLDDQDRAKRGADPRIDAAEITADGEELMHMSYRREGPNGTQFRLDRIASEHAVFQRLVSAIIESSTTTEALTSDDRTEIDEAISGLITALDVHSHGLLPDSVSLRARQASEPSATSLLMPISKGNRSEDIANALHVYFPGILQELLSGLSDAIAGELGCMRYLGPVRERPARHLTRPDQRDSNWEAGGAFAWDVLVRDAAVRERANQWLGGHPGVSGADATFAYMSKLAEESIETIHKARWMKTPYQLFVDRYTAHTELRDPLVQAFIEQPLTLLQRRELLTQELSAVYAALNEQYETDQVRAEAYAKELEPWITKIQGTRSAAEREKLVEEAMAFFEAKQQELLDSPEAQWEMHEEQQAAQSWHDDAVARAAEFLTTLDKNGTGTLTELRLWDEDKRTAVSLCDVGFGISQVLPVLVLAYGSKDQLVAIEQPEIHLHPALQAELADVFVESALGTNQNTFILETHSEHLILRLLRRVRDKTIDPDDLCVLFVSPSRSGSHVRQLEVDEDGDFVDEWPGGFFEEAFREKFAGR